MRVLFLFAGLLLVAPAHAQGQGALPLKEGRYSAGGCDRFNESHGYIGIGIHKDGPDKGRQFIVPQAERKEGFCTLQKLAPLGGVLSGVAECDSGSRINPMPLGTYRFNYTIHDATSFTSLGKRYGWCPSRR
jgi:hypothetical protein